jgi:glycosyltransferase involved in cell wall biosynthesis
VVGVYRGASSLIEKKSEKNRILFLITSLEQGGAEQVLYDTVTGLDREKWDCVVLAMRGRGPYFKKLRSEGYAVESLDVGRKFAPVAFLKLLVRIAFFRPDIIHSHLFHADIPGRFAGIIAGGSKRPIFISHQHIPEQRSLPARTLLDRSTKALVDQFVCVSQAVADHVEQSLRMDAKKLSILPNGRELREFLEIEPDHVAGEIWRLGTVGRLDDQKDHLLLLESLALLKRKGHLFHCVIAGDGPLKGKLGKRISELDLDAEVDLLGRREDIPTVLSELNLFIMSSKYEGLPIAVIEAMAASLPVLGTDVAGLHELLESNCGRLVPYRNVQALAEAIEELMENEILRFEMGRRGRERARLHYSKERMLKDLDDLYKRLLNSR